MPRPVVTGVNDLQSQFPDIAAEAYGWDPSTIAKASVNKLEWKCSEGHIYSSSPNHRTGKGTGCPYCSGNQLLKGFNDLKTRFPNIAAEAYEWDPSTVTAGSGKIQDWICSKDHIYSSSANHRTGRGYGCPVCSNHQVLAGFNDLKTKFPNIAAEAYGWDPSTVTAGTGKKRDWKCSEGHIYSSSPNHRTGKGTGCPICGGDQVLAGFNDLKTKFPNIAAEAYGWDPSTVTAGSGKILDWRCKIGHIYPSVVAGRTGRGTGCPICCGKQVLKGFNDLKTKFPNIAAEAYGWDPSTVTAGTSKKRDWKCSEGHIYSSIVAGRTGSGNGCPVCCGQQLSAGFNDLKTKFPDIAAEAYEWDPQTVMPGTNQKKDWRCKVGHIYSTSPNNRTGRGHGCPVCSNNQVLAGFNDLQTKFPDIAAEAYRWDPSLVTAGSSKIQEWKCNLGHIWSSQVKNRTLLKTGCLVCSGQQVLKGFNDLKTKFPNIAAEAYGWDPSTVTAGTGKKRDWKCSEGHIYSSIVGSRTGRGSGCPICGGDQVLAGFNDLQSKFPDIAAEAYEWDPQTVTIGTHQKKNWKCKEGHIYSSTVANRTYSGNGCPLCAVYGFKPDKDAWFYLMERPGEQQLGITNDFSTRIKKHESNGWSLIEHTTVPSKGQKVLDTENAFKKWLKEEIGLMEGTTENWSTTSMEVQSLAELKARSGIETDLF